MKITDLAILFVIITLPFVQILRIQADNLENTTYKNVLLNRYLDTAVEDASEAMILRGVGQKTIISREKALDAFLCTLFTNFNLMDNEIARNRFMAYIPVILVIDYDGYWVYSMEEYTNADGDKELKMMWKPKKPFSYQQNGFVYLFSLDSHVRILDTSANEFYEGYAEDLKPVFFEALLQDDSMFEAVRKKTIVEAIKMDINEAINHHNTYARHFGISYQFSLPSISDADWNKNIDDIGFLAFFQGLPTGLSGERFNSFALGAARIVRKDNYYIQQAANGLFYYHREACPDLTSLDEVFDSREECALEGAFPCKCVSRRQGY